MHGNEITSMSFSKNGELLITSDDGVCSLWSSGMWERRIVWRLDCRPSTVILNDGRAAIFVDNALLTWNRFNMMSEICTLLLDHPTMVTLNRAENTSALCVDGSGNLVTASKEGVIAVWDISTGLCSKVLLGHTDKVYALALLDGGLVVSVSADRTIRAWSLVGGICQATLRGHGHVESVCSLRKLGGFASGHCLYIKIWSRSEGSFICKSVLRGHEYVVTSLIQLSDGRLVSGSYDRTIRFWDIATGNSTRTVSVHQNVVSCLVALPNSRGVVSGGRDGQVCITLT